MCGDEGYKPKVFWCCLWQGQNEKVLFQERFGEVSSGIDIAIVARCRAPSTEVTPAFVRHSHCLYLTYKYFETFLVFISSRELKTNHVSMI